MKQTFILFRSGLVLGLIALMNWPWLKPAEAEEPKSDPAISAVNSAVDQLEKRISSGDKSLPTLMVSYDFHDATEGVPPDFKFYYETKKVGAQEKAILRVSKTHIGREVFSVDHIFYFDEDGRPTKYLVVNSGVSGGPPPSRNAIIYGRSGKAIWSTPETSTPMTFKAIQDLFNSLHATLGRF